MDLEKMNNDIPKLDDGSIDYALASRKLYIMGVRRGAEFIRAMVDEVRAGERERIAAYFDKFNGPNHEEFDGCQAAEKIRNLGDE